MAIYVAGIEVDQIEVALKNKPQSLLDYSPKGTVPVVVTPNGKVIDESRDIMQWALDQADPNNWLLHNDEEQQLNMKRLVDSCDSEFKPLLDRYKYSDRYPEQTPEEHRHQADFFLHRLEEKLSQHAFLIDENLRFADVAIFPFIRQFAGVDNSWFAQSPYKNLQHWLDVCINTDLFKAIMQPKQ